ncbi:MAG: tripartite tricarboxylate transporter TctB family protein [Oscillospiraceae bacterium]
MEKQNGQDKIVALTLLVLGILIFALTARINLNIKLASGDPGPRFFPYISAVGLILCGGGLLLSNIHDSKMLTLNKNNWKNLFKLSLLLLLYMLGLKTLGYLISTPIITFLLIRVLAYGKKINGIVLTLFSLLLTGLLYGLFVHILNIMLPTGMLF